MSARYKLGIDVGRVIINGDGPDTQTMILAKTMEQLVAAPATTGMWASVSRLSDRFGQPNVYIVSKAGLDTSCRTLVWFYHHQFFSRANIHPNNVKFCRNREDKAPICRELGITHFIDDREDVLGYLKGIVPNLFQFKGNWEKTANAVMETIGGYAWYSGAL